MDKSGAANHFASAPFETNGWDFALRKLASQTRSARMQLLAVGNRGIVPFNWTTDAPDHFAEKFLEIDGGDPRRNWRIAHAGEPFEVVSEHHYDQMRAKLKCDIYDDYVSQFDVPFGCQSVLARDDDKFIGLAALRTRADGRTSEEDRQAFADATPHVLAAVRMQKAIEHRGAELAAGALEAIGVAAFVLDSSGNVGALTRAAETKVGPGGPLRLMKRQLTGATEASNLQLQRALSAMLSGKYGRPAKGFWIETTAGPNLCEVFALPAREWSLGFDPRVLVVVGAADRNHAEEVALLRGLFGFTPAEADIVARLRKGATREDISAARMATPNTVLSQIKSIFQKAQVHRETDLLAKIGRLLR